MKEARILLVEDQETERIKDIVEMISPHRIVETATNLKRARNCVQQLYFGHLDADVIVLDANLQPHDESGNDAATILHDIRDLGLQVPVIGNSSQMMEAYGLRVDADANKNLDRLLNILDELPEPA